MADIVIFGTGHASEMMKVYIDRESQTDKVVGYVVDRQYYKDKSVGGLPVAIWEEIENVFPPSDVELLGPISHHGINRLREERHAEAREKGYGLASFIHPRASISTDKIGEACIILDLVTVQPCAEIGNGVIIWSSSIVGHHTKVGDYCFLSSNVGLGGRCTVGRRSYLAAQAGIAPGLTIGEGSAILNAGKVQNHVPDNGVVKGDESRHMKITADRAQRFI